MRRAPRPRLAWAFAALLATGLAALPAQAQRDSREAERRLERVRKELNEVARERRRIESQRGDAARQLRAADEQVARSARALRDTESDLAAQRTALEALAGQRDALQSTLGAQREELKALLRAGYVAGNAAPLKLMLSQDRAADANRALAYHRHLQRHRATRIQALREELAGLEAMEREIRERQAALEQATAQQRQQVATLERDRRTHAQTVAQLDDRYRDRNTREKALGRDAKSLETVLRQLRAAAAKAEAERKAAAAREARRRSEAARGTAQTPRPAGQATSPAPARGTPVQVGGLGWPVSGALLAGYGGRMPDGRSSNGVLIGAAAGATVRAVADGSVVFAEWMTGYGMILIVDHGDGTMSLYAHCETLLKEPGTTVRRGDPVATVGNSGGQGQPALYFELRRNGQPVNPGGLLQRR